MTSGADASTPGGSPPNVTLVAAAVVVKEPGAHWPCTELMNSVLTSNRTKKNRQ